MLGFNSSFLPRMPSLPMKNFLIRGHRNLLDGSSTPNDSKGESNSLSRSLLKWLKGLDLIKEIIWRIILGGGSWVEREATRWPWGSPFPHAEVGIKEHTYHICPEDDDKNEGLQILTSG